MTVPRLKTNNNYFMKKSSKFWLIVCLVLLIIFNIIVWTNDEYYTFGKGTDGQDLFFVYTMIFNFFTSIPIIAYLVIKLNSWLDRPRKHEE